MAFTPAEKVGAVALGLAAMAAYAVIGWSITRPHGPTLRARLAALLSLREPAILLDSARYMALLGWMRSTPDLQLTTEHLRRGVAWTEPVGIFRWVSVFAVPPVAVPILVWVYRAALALAIVGVLGRASCAVAALLFALVWSVAFSTAGYSVHNHVVFMILLSLALSPEPFVPIWRYGAALRERRSLATVGTYAAYARFSAAAAIVTVYVQTGLEKILNGGPRWVNGITLQGHSMRKGHLSTELARLPVWTFVALAVVVLAWETFFGFVLYYRRWRPLAVLSAWSFHEFVRRIMGVTPFAFMMTAVLFIYSPYEAWTWAAARLRKKGSKARAPDIEPELPPASERDRARALRRPTVLLLFALLVAQWVPMLLRRGVYPFLPNTMFPASLAEGDLIPAEALIHVRLDDGTERAISSTDAIAVHSATFVEFAFTRYRSPFKDQREKYAGKERQFCEDVLRSIVRHSEPRAVEMTLSLDIFRAGKQGLERELLQKCTLAAPPPSG